MEFYWAYADYEMGMNLVEELYKYVIKETFGTLKFKIKDFNIDFEKKWDELRKAKSKRQETLFPSSDGPQKRLID